MGARDFLNDAVSAQESEQTGDATRLAAALGEVGASRTGSACCMLHSARHAGIAPIPHRVITPKTG